MKTKAKTILTAMTVMVIALVMSLSIVPVVRADALDDSCASKENGFPGAMCAAIFDLRAKLNSLQSIIAIDAAGNATIQPTGNLTLDSGGMTTIMDEAMLESNVTTMGNSTVMGDTMLEGNSTTMKNSTVMGDTMLEGNSTTMKNSTVMGDTMLEGDTTLMQETNVAGTLVRPFATATIDLLGRLIPDGGVLSSSIAITQRESPLFSIPPAALEGTTVIIKYFPGLDAPPNLSVSSCLFSTCVPTENIALKPESTRYRMNPNDFLALNWNGTRWEEIARSGGLGAIAVLQTDLLPVAIGATATRSIACDPIAADFGSPGLVIPGDGLVNSSLLSANFTFTGTGEGLTFTQIGINTLGGGGAPGGGQAVDRDAVEVFTVTVQNSGGTPESIQLKARCLVL